MTDRIEPAPYQTIGERDAKKKMTDAPRTDAVMSAGTVGQIAMRQHAEQLERELAAMEHRAMDCVALNERQAVNFAKCQAELAERIASLDRCDDARMKAERELAEARKALLAVANAESASQFWALKEMAASVLLNAAPQGEKP